MATGQTHLDIQRLRFDYVVVDHEDFQSFLLWWKSLDQLGQFRTTNTISTVNRQAPIRLLSSQGCLESSRKFFIVALFCRRTICIFRSLSVETSDHIVELWCRQKAVIFDFCSGCRQSIKDTAQEPGT